jgi:hypothetical protein
MMKERKKGTTPVNDDNDNDVVKREDMAVDKILGGYITRHDIHLPHSPHLRWIFGLSVGNMVSGSGVDRWLH